MPLFTVTGRMGACGNTNRIATPSGRSISGTIGSKSCPSAPSPCSQITATRGAGPVSTSTVSRRRVVTPRAEEVESTARRGRRRSGCARHPPPRHAPRRPDPRHGARRGTVARNGRVGTAAHERPTPAPGTWPRGRVARRIERPDRPVARGDGAPSAGRAACRQHREATHGAERQQRDPEPHGQHERPGLGQETRIPARQAEQLTNGAHRESR